MSLLPTTPWLFCAAAALAFGLMARRFARPWFPWAFLAGVSSLILTTLILGLAEAAFIPISRQAQIEFSIMTISAAVLLNACLGWLVTTGIHRQHVVLVDLAKRAVARVLTSIAGRMAGQPVSTGGLALATKKQNQQGRADINRCKTEEIQPSGTRHVPS